MNTSLLLDRTHPDYDLYYNFYILLYASYKGGNEYLQLVDDYLIQHRLEDDSDYTARQDRSYFLNYCKRVVEAYTNFIFKEEVVRSEDPILKEFFKNADGKGGSFTSVMQKISSLSSVYGFMDAIVDAPVASQERLTRRDVKEQKTLPYVVLRNPIETPDWSFDEWGALNWVLYKYVFYEDADPEVERDTENIYRYKIITRDAWEEFNESGSINTGTNELKEVFIHRCYNRTDGGTIGTSLIGDIALINKEIFNWCSLISEQISRQTFSQLVVPDDGDHYNSVDSEGNQFNSFVQTVGTAWAFTFPASSGQPPRFISPDHEQIATIWKMVQDHIAEIYRLVGLTATESTDSASGRAKQRQFISVEAALRAKARTLEQAENEILRLVCLRQNKDFTEDMKSKYPTHFDVLGFVEELETTFKIITANASETLNKYLLKKIATSVLSEATSEVKEKARKEIDAGDGSILVTGSSYTRISPETGTIIGEKDSPTNDDTEAPSTVARTLEEGETELASKIRRSADIDNKGQSNAADTVID